MKEKIQLLSVLKYEKDGKVHSRLSFIFADSDKCSTDGNMHGYSEVALYYDSDKPYQNLPVNCFGQIVEANFIEKINPFNPMRESTIIDSIKFIDKTYDLI